MGGQQCKIDYNYGSIVEKNQLCEKRMMYDVSAKDVFLQQLKQISILQSLEEIDKITFCGQPNEIKVLFQYNQFTLHQQIEEQEFQLKEVDIVNIIKQVLLNINPNKIQIHPKEILLPEYITLDPEIFLLKSDLQRIRQGNIKIQDYFLAPEILRGKCKSNITAQIFSIGLISIFMMTKITPYNSGIYQKITDEQGQTLQFQEQNLDDYINKINTGIYSQLLKNTIKDMLLIEPKLRLNEEQILQRLSEVQMFHSRKTLKLQDLSRNSSQIKLEINDDLKQSSISYNYLERPSDNKLIKTEGKLTIRTVCNSPKNKENIEVEFITKKEKKQNYSFSACSSRSHIRGVSVKPLKKKIMQQNESTVKRWK